MKIEEMSEHVGAEVTGIDLREPVPEAELERLRAALVERVALVIRDQEFTPHDFLAAVSLFGEPMQQHFTEDQVPDCPLVNVLSNQKVDETGARMDPGGGWHTDHTNHQRPPKFTALYMVAMSDEGGNTAVCNTRAGYESLPPEMRERLRSMRTNNVYVGSAARFTSTVSARAQAKHAPDPVVHPLVRTNPDNGKQALYFHPIKTENVVGMTPADTQDLFDDLMERIVRPEFVYSHQWRPGDMLIWDNRSSLHRGEPVGDPSQLRQLYRVIVRGDVPY